MKLRIRNKKELLELKFKLNEDYFKIIILNMIKLIKNFLHLSIINFFFLIQGKKVLNKMEREGGDIWGTQK